MPPKKTNISVHFNNELKFCPPSYKKKVEHVLFGRNTKKTNGNSQIPTAKAPKPIESKYAKAPPSWPEGQSWLEPKNQNIRIHVPEYTRGTAMPQHVVCFLFLV